MKISANIIGKHLTKIINHDLFTNSFSYSAKIFSVKPIFEKEKKNRSKTYTNLLSF